MAFPVYLPWIAAIVLAVAMPVVARRLPPRAEVWSLTVAATVAATAWALSLAMIAFTGLSGIGIIARRGHWSAHRWRNLDPVAVQAAYAAGLILIACAAFLVVTVRRERRTRREVAAITGALGGDDLVVFVDDDTPHAYAVGGRRPRIVVSRGLVRALGPAERRALLAHEEAHVRLRHHAHLRVLRLCAAANPLLRPCLRAGVLAVERWADEETAARLGDRPLVARTLLRAALAGAGGPVPAGVLAHTAAGDVSHRVKALMAAPPPARRAAAAVLAGLLLATSVTPVYAATHLGGLIGRVSES